MPAPFYGRSISFAVSDSWLADPSLPVFVSQQYMTYRFVPLITLRDGILYATLQIREVLNPVDKAALFSQLQMLSNPMMAVALLMNLGIQPLSVVGPVQQIQIQGNTCAYRILDAVAMLSGQAVRCYIGVIDFGVYATEIIAMAVVGLWPVLLPQIIEMCGSIAPLSPGMPASESVRKTPVFVNQDQSGKIAFKINDPKAGNQVFDEMHIPQYATVNIHVDNRTVMVGKDTEIKGAIVFGDNSNLEGTTMGENRTINVSGNLSGNVQIGVEGGARQTYTDNRGQGDWDAAEFSRLIEELLVAVKQSGATDANARLAAMELEKVKLQAAAGEEKGAVEKTMDSAVKYMKKSEEIVKTGASIGSILLKVGKVVGTALAWL